jgi:hypothetical protein
MNAKPLLLSALILGMAGELVSQAQINHTRPYGALGFSVDNPVPVVAIPLMSPSPPGWSPHQFPRLDFGLSIHCLAASEHLEKDFSGIGLNLACHLNRHVALLLQRQYCLLTAREPDYYVIPFSQIRRIMAHRLLRLSVGKIEHTFFLQAGFAFLSDVESAFVYGLGFSLPLPAHLLLITTVEHRQFGSRYNLFDEHTEVKLELAYTFRERGRSGQHLLGIANPPQGLMKPPWLEIGLNANGLLNSIRFQDGYSGLGFSLTLNIYRHFAIEYRHQFWNVTSKDTTNYHTPFQQLRTPVRVYLLRFPVYFVADALLFQFGIVHHQKPRADGDGEGGFTTGLGYRYPLTNRLNLLVAIGNYWLGSFDIGGGYTYDGYRELSLELTFSIPYPVP